MATPHRFSSALHLVLWFGLSNGISACSNEAGIDATDEPEPEPNRDDGEGDTDDDGTAADDADDDSTEDDDVGPRCEAPHFPDESEPALFERLEARVVDVDGTPVGDTTAQTCGVNLCLFGDTDAAGNVLHVGPQQLQRAAFKYGDGLEYAQLALLLPEQSEHELGDQITIAFPTLSTGQPLAEGGTLSSTGVAIVIDAATEVEIDLLSFRDEEQHVFLAAEFPSDAFPDAVDPTLDLEMLFALAPLKTKFCPPAKLSLPNTLQWAPGQDVELFVHSTDVRGDWAAYGEWGKVSDAVVTEDGDSIETVDDQGIPMLAVLGVRRTP